MGQEAYRACYPQAGGVAVRGWGLLTGWGAGLQSLPTLPAVTPPGQRLLPVATPDLASERLRRATREFLLGVAAVQAALDHSAPRGGWGTYGVGLCQCFVLCGGQLDFCHE